MGRLTRRSVRKLHREATRWWRNGVHWETGRVSAPASGPNRIAFDAGREWERKRSEGKRQKHWLSTEMPLDVWQRVLADSLRRDKYGCF